MKLQHLIFVFIAFTIISCDNTDDPVPPLNYADSISMGASYAEEIFYSLENGIVKSSPRSAWDIAFSTNPMSSTVLINEGYGVMLYAYPDLDWDNIDTSGIAGWPALYNADTSWYNGAFDRNATGHPDYGWGVYNSTNHDVIGDSLFILRLSDGSVKKIMIEQRAAATNSYSIKYGNIDEAGTTKEIPCGDYISKNFVYFSFSGDEILDIEPESDSWDLLFTKYYDESIPYNVTGVLTNMDREVAEVRNTDPADADPADAEFSTDISTIGSDWKSFDMGTYTYVVEPDLCYFVKSNDQTYKITFTGTDGSASGKMVFDIEHLD